MLTIISLKHAIHLFVSINFIQYSKILLQEKSSRLTINLLHKYFLGAKIVIIKKISRLLFLPVFMLATTILFTPPGMAVPPSIQLLEGNHILVPIGQVAHFEIPDGISVVVVGDKDIAEIIVPPGQNKMALINTKKAGITNVLIWTNKSNAPTNFMIEVSPNTRNEQIIARVKVVEITTGTEGNIGVDWSDSITFQEAQPSAPFKFGLPVRTDTLTAKINAMLSDKRAKILAQPTLVCANGEKSSFLSGGEVPLAITDNNKITIQWKPYGIGLSMEAKIQGNDMIYMKLDPEVSSLDKGNSITIGGNAVIPAFTKRSASTTVAVKENDSIVIAGLLRDEDVEVTNKIPLLGDIPVLGYLFTTFNLSKVKTELVFIVTPSIYKAKVPMPEMSYGTDPTPPSSSPTP